MRASHGATLAAALLTTLGLYAYAFSGEQPVGDLHGRVIAADTGRPLAKMGVVVRPASPSRGADTFRARTDADGRFAVRRLPAGFYEVETTASVYENRPLRAMVREGAVETLEVSLRPGEPFLWLNIHQAQQLPGRRSRVALHGFRQGSAVQLRLLAVEDEGLVLHEAARLRQALEQHPASRAPRPLPPGLRELRRWSHPVRKVDAEGVFYDFVPVEPLPAGLYVLEVAGQHNRNSGTLFRTELALVTKRAYDRLTVFAAHLGSGKPLPGAALRLVAGGRETAVTTDSRGLAELRLPPGTETAELLGRLGPSLAYSRLWVSGDRPRRYRFTTYTDRSVYRPGHRVRFKGVARLVQGAGYAVPAARSVQVEVVDDQDTTLYRHTLTLNERGACADEFVLPTEARTGLYTLKATLEGEQFEDRLTVAAYRKPEWKVEVTVPRPRYVLGDRVPVSVRAEYYYGQPVGGAQVRYTVYREPYWRPWLGEDGEEEEVVPEWVERGGGEVVAEGTLRTDADGTAHLVVDTRAGASTADPEFREYRYTVEASVADASNRVVDGNGSFRLAVAAITVELRPDTAVAAPGDAVGLAVRAVDAEERPAAALRLLATTVHRSWNGATEQERLLGEQEVLTDAQGRARLQVTLSETGLVTVRLRGSDARGNPVAASADLWCSTVSGGDLGARYPELALIPDRQQYRVGDTAQVLVNTDRPGATALLSLEADDVLQVRTVHLARPSTVVRLAVTRAWEPNIFLHASFVKDGAFVASEARLNVSPAAHRLQVSVSADREQYRPGDTATFTLRATDPTGRPAPAELSFALVDEAVFAVRPARADPLWSAFYPRRRNTVLTAFSFPDIYLGDADKSGGDTAVRRNFPDTAHWEPFVRTGPDGTARVRVRLPDNLTSWRATVVGHDAHTRVGEGTHNVRVTRELTLRLQTPRFATEGDRLTLTAVAHNYSAAPLEVRVTLRSTGLEVEGDTARSLRLEPGAAGTVAWEARATAPGEARLVARAEGGAHADGMELGFPVLPFARREVLQRGGALTGESAVVEFAASAAAVGGELEVRLAPSLAGVVLGAMDYLGTYPYGCTEQTMSSFMPNVAVLNTLRGLGLRRPELEARVPEMARAGLLRLYRYQHSDGGWGWWEYDATEPWMTAYVLYGLVQARRAGLEVSPRVLESALAAAESMAQHPTLAAEDAALLAWSLAAAGRRAQLPRLLSRFHQPGEGERLPVRALACAALAEAGEATPGVPGEAGSEAAGSPRRARALVERLWRRAVREEGLLFWRNTASGSEEGLRYASDAEATALALRAVLAVNPTDERLRDVVRWLVLRRAGNRWESTRDTAWVLLALSEYMRATRELLPDYRVSVLLNEREIHSGQVSAGEALEEIVLRVPVRELPAANRLEVRKEGDGVLYHTVTVTQLVSAPGFAAASSRPGLTVRREYFRMTTRRDATGHLVVEPEARPSTRFRQGDRVLARLTIVSTAPLEHVMVEDPLPSGFEVQDRGNVGLDEWGQWWSYTDVRDEKVALFARHVEAGERVLEYYLRPEAVGAVRALPAELSDMYRPALRASTPEARLEVTR